MFKSRAKKVWRGGGAVTWRESELRSARKLVAGDIHCRALRWEPDREVFRKLQRYLCAGCADTRCFVKCNPDHLQWYDLGHLVRTRALPNL